MPQHRFPVRLWDSQDLDSGGTLVSGVIDCRKADPEGLMLRAVAAGGDASVKVQVAFSNDGTNFNSYAAQDDIVSATATEYAATPEEYHLLNVPWAPFIKLKITDTVTQATVIDGDLWLTEL